MGTQNSAPAQGQRLPDGGSPFPSGYSQINEDIQAADDPRSSFVSHHLVTPPFNGVWSILHVPQLSEPETRIGQFTCSNGTDCFVGFGSRNQQYFRDLWRLKLDTLTWSRIELKGDVPSERNGLRAVIVKGTHILVFGGFFSGTYYGDLFAIEIASGTVQRLETTGPAPSPRTGAIVGTHNNKFFVWGGYNGNWPNELHVLDLGTLTWRVLATDVVGRTGVPFVHAGSRIISYGGSKQEGVVVIDMDRETVEVVPATGAAPPSENMGAGMAMIDDFVLYYGGKDASDKMGKTLVYALDLNRMWWFLFHIRPDYETVSLHDGHITDNGLFMVPRLHSFSFAVSKTRRAAVCFFGVPVRDKVEFSVFWLGNALSVLNHRTDMKNMLKFNSGQR